MDALKKILICGDSYMAFDDGRCHGGRHWAHHLGPEFEIFNRASVGASNTMISWQLMSALEEFSPDFIVLGFTAIYRLEVSKQKTTSWPDVMALPGRREFYESYVRHIDPDLELHRNVAIIDQTIRTAQEHAPTLFVMNNFDCHLQDIRFQSLKQSLANEMKCRLRGHQEWAFDDPEYCSFHVIDPQVHLDFASEIRRSFLTS